jgi:pectin lyase
MLEGTDTGKGLFEGCVFTGIPNIADEGFVGQLFSSDEASVGQCSAALGRDCQTNVYTDSGPFSYSDDLFAAFEGLTVVDADPAADIQDEVMKSAGNTLAT